MLYEMPPMLSGGEKQHIKDLRDYLVRLVHKLNESQGSAAAAAVSAREDKSV